MDKDDKIIMAITIAVISLIQIFLDLEYLSPILCSVYIVAVYIVLKMDLKKLCHHKQR